jgi:hypothetical protein
MIEGALCYSISGEPESLGVFGLSWQEKLAKDMGLKFTPLNASIAGGYVDKLHNAYKIAITKEKYPVFNTKALADYIAKVTKEDINKVKLFLDSLKRMALAGQIPYGVYDPAQSAPAKALSFGKSIVDKAIIAGAVVLGAYMLIPKLLTMKKSQA